MFLPRALQVTMPQMPKREILEQTGQLDVYQSVRSSQPSTLALTYNICLNNIVMNYYTKNDRNKIQGVC